MVLPVTTTSSQIVRCPAIPTIPAITQRRPTDVLPEIPRAAGDHGVRADAHVVPDLHVVVDPDALFDDGVPDRPAVHRRASLRSRRRRRITTLPSCGTFT